MSGHTKDRGLPARALARLAGAGLVVIVAMAGACDRIAYYSYTGSTGGEVDGDDDDGSVNPPSTAATGTNPVSRQAVLEGVAVCADALYGEIADAAQELDAAAGALAQSPTNANEAAARAAWSKTVGLWQQAEVLRIGPAGPASLPGGLELRHYVYSWPLVARCQVDQLIVNEKYADDGFVVTGLVNTRGLYATEYLLFHEGTDNGCSDSSSINAQGTWAALGAQGLAARKRAYAAVLAQDVASKIASIKAGWSGDGGFGHVLTHPGSSQAQFVSDQAALNAISDGLFYVEHEVKDIKLGLPLGKTDDCASATCVDQVESLYARVARDHVRNNLLGFQRVFEGCDAAAGTGFDDLLRSLGAGDLADRMSADVSAAIAVADGLDSSDLITLIQDDKAAVDSLHAAVKRISDALKTDFVTVLDLELPTSLEGDND